MGTRDVLLQPDAARFLDIGFFLGGRIQFSPNIPTSAKKRAEPDAPMAVAIGSAPVAVAIGIARPKEAVHPMRIAILIAEFVPGGFLCVF
jgi:hypothetical protein